MLRGYDVSAFQGTSVPRADFIFIKATEGRDYASSRFAAQWADAGRKGLLRGAYHFARPEESTPESQADRLIAKARAVSGEMLALDLEASKLSQKETNSWARIFGDRLRERAPGVTTVAYLGSGYAKSNTGRGLADHFDFWWFPQYPSTARTSTWRTTFAPAFPSPNTTGWERPHIWQFTDNFNGLDASVSWLTLDQLAHGGHNPTPLEDDMPYGGQLPAGKGSKANISFPHGAEKAIGLVYDNPTPAQVRVAFHHKAGGGEVYTLKVGGPRTTTDAWPAKTVQTFKTPADGDWASLTRLDDGTEPVGWDMS